MADNQSPALMDAYLAALPVRPLLPPSPLAPRRYNVPRYQLLKPYNGFSGEERRRGGQLGGWLVAAGCIVMPARCDICASPGPLALHGENYYHIVSDPALCHPCHRAIHLRPWQWDAWRRIVDAAAVTGEEWFALAPRYGLDLARHLRDRWGWRAADIESSLMAPLPDAIATILPGNLFPHPKL